MLKNEDERIEDLGVNNLKIIQNKNAYCFTSDAVLLANFARIKRGDILADLCSGSGVIPILIAGKTDKLKRVYLVEIQSYMAELSARNAELNNMRFEIINSSVQNCLPELIGKGINVITVNPPYERAGSGMKNGSDCVAISRQEIYLNLGELLFACGKILSTGGKLFLVHRADRLAEIMHEMQKNDITPKRMRLIKAKPHSKPHLVLIEGLKNGGQNLEIMPDLVLLNADGSEPPEVKAIYSEREK